MTTYSELTIADQLDLTHRMVRSAEEQRVQLVANIRMNEALGANAKIDLGRRKIAQNFVQTKRRELTEVDISIEVLREQITELNVQLDDAPTDAAQAVDPADIAESGVVVLEAEENGAVPAEAQNGRKRLTRV